MKHLLISATAAQERAAKAADLAMSYADDVIDGSDHAPSAIYWQEQATLHYREAREIMRALFVWHAAGDV